MNPPNQKNRLVLLLPWLLFGFAIWTVNQSESEVRVQFERAQACWRRGDHVGSIEIYRRIAESFPESRYAPSALWEIATTEYINLVQVDRATLTYQLIAEEYPDHPLAIEALRKLAEIQELDYQDTEGAVEYWRQLLRKPLEITLRDEVLFRLGNAWFKSSELDRAQSVFEQLLDSSTISAYLMQQASIRLGTISQLHERHPEAIAYFEDALRRRDCDQCRLAAQLGLIESHEVLGDLGKALQVAAGIDERVYPSGSKRELIARLEQKQRFFDPTTWTGAR
jgi:tetratricopeptide (TPR) repeat protein